MEAAVHWAALKSSMQDSALARARSYRSWSLELSGQHGAELSLIVAAQSQPSLSSTIVLFYTALALACLKFGSFTSPRYSSQQTSGTGSGSVPRRTTHFFHPRPAFACGAWCAEQLQLLTFRDPFSSSDTASPRRCRALQVPLTPQTPPAASTCTCTCTLGLTRTLAETRRIDAGHAAASVAHWILLGFGREQRCRLSAAQP
ncbi:hypothetical protein B5807_08644 [Epicoccum nigrum]|jgi:hypothetical protein|uniref:Uncharacterized protein n=1 Tax=Epicoccum nigrum TaxID=105696 RepID=A0A1Y2LSE1_EPING|nr:hypothetical protein B5807_08644 [Epicoccum nigrum]